MYHTQYENLDFTQNFKRLSLNLVLVMSTVQAFTHQRQVAKDQLLRAWDAAHRASINAKKMPYKT